MNKHGDAIYFDCIKPKSNLQKHYFRNYNFQINNFDNSKSVVFRLGQCNSALRKIIPKQRCKRLPITKLTIGWLRTLGSDHPRTPRNHSGGSWATAKLCKALLTTFNALLFYTVVFRLQHFELDKENLQMLALRLSCAANSLYKELLSVDDNCTMVQTQTMSDVHNIITTIKPLVCWLDRWVIESIFYM